MGKIGEWFEKQLQLLDRETEVSEEVADTQTEVTDTNTDKSFEALRQAYDELNASLMSSKAETEKLKQDLQLAQAANLQLASAVPYSKHQSFSEILRGEPYHPLYKEEK